MQQRNIFQQTRMSRSHGDVNNISKSYFYVLSVKLFFMQISTMLLCVIWAYISHMWWSSRCWCDTFCHAFVFYTHVFVVTLHSVQRQLTAVCFTLPIFFNCFMRIAKCTQGFISLWHKIWIRIYTINEFSLQNS